MDDVSNKVIFVLVILTVVISLFSTFLLLGNVKGPLGGTQISQSESTDSGRIFYRIQKPVIEKTEDVVGGKISFQIENP